MIDFKKVFVDTAPFIYFIEKDSNNPQYYEKVKDFFKYGYDNDRRKSLSKDLQSDNIRYENDYKLRETSMSGS